MCCFDGDAIINLYIRLDAIYNVTIRRKEKRKRFRADGEQKTMNDSKQDINSTENATRIETLIPYKETTFSPKARIGTLDLSSTPWAISAKLGRFLLSGIAGDAIHEVAR